MSNNNVCGYNAGNCPAGHQTSTCSKYLKPFFSFIVSVLLTLSMTQLCEKYSTRSSVDTLKTDLNTLRHSLNVLVEVTEGMRIQIKELIEKIEVFNADKTGMPDFALETLGGTVLTIRDTEPYTGSSQLSVFGISICAQDNTPRAIIQPTVHPGQCWSFKGSQGTSVILLVGFVNIHGFSLEHISPKIAPTGEISAAPKDFSVLGLRDVDDKDSFLFGEYVYDKYGPPVQYFEVKNKPGKPYEIVELNIHSNHGNRNHTCVYRFRVHGTLASSARGIS